MEWVARACAAGATPFDVMLRLGFVVLCLLVIWTMVDDRRTRPKREQVDILADDVEQRFGAYATGMAEAAVLAIRLARNTSRYKLLKAVADELALRSDRANRKRS